MRDSLRQAVRRAVAGVLSTGLLAASSIACAQAIQNQASYEIDLPSQDLHSALQSLALVSRHKLLYRSELVAGKASVALRGRYTAEEAIEALLSGTDLTFEITDSDVMLIKSRSERASSAATARKISDATAGKERRVRLALASASPATPAPADSTGSRANDAGGPRNVTIAEVVVSAQKRLQRAIDVPMSLSAMSAEELQSRGVTNVVDLMYSTPNVAISEVSPAERRIYMRGIANNYDSALVGIYLDEAAVTVSGFAALDLRLFDLERVEVLRGPQGTLYGYGSAGGTIRFITKDPQLERYAGRLDVSSSFTEHGEPSQEVTGVLNLPVVENVFGVRISGTYGNFGGWIDQPAAGREDINNQDLRNVRVKSLWQPSEALAIKGTVVIHRNEGDGASSGADVDYELHAAVDPLARTSFLDEYDLFNVTGEYDFGRVSLISSSTCLDTTKRSVYSSSVDLPSGLLSATLSNPQTSSSRLFNQELRLTSGGGGSLHWTTGAFYSDHDLDKRSLYETRTGTPPLSGPAFVTDSDRVVYSKSWAVFADASYALTQRLTLGAGIRYFEDDAEQVLNGNWQRATFSSVDPRIYATYALGDHANVYANVSEGFRSGAFSNIDFPPADPETIRNYELGSKMALPAAGLALDVAAFFTEYQDYQSFSLIPPLLYVTLNAGDAEVRGFEATFSWQATDHLRLELSGSLTDHELVKVRPEVLAKRKGDPLDYAVDYNYSVSGVYELDWAAGVPGFVRLDYNEFGPTQLVSRSTGTFFESDVIGLMNVHVGLERNNWSLRVFANNLLQENGQQDALGAYGFGARPKPLTAGVTVSYDFR